MTAFHPMQSFHLAMPSSTEAALSVQKSGAFCGKMLPMFGREIIAKLRENEAALRARGVSHAALFIEFFGTPLRPRIPGGRGKGA